MIKFECDDGYEAEKLAGLLSGKKDSETFVSGISGIYKNEVVIKLRDNSSHSVIMKDDFDAANLKTFIEKVALGTIKIREIMPNNSIIQLALED